MRKAIQIFLPLLIAAVLFSSCGNLGAVVSGSTLKAGSSDEGSALQLEGSKENTITNYSTTLITKDNSNVTSTMKVSQMGNKMRYESDGSVVYIDGDKGDYVTVDVSTNTGTKVTGEPSNMSYNSPFTLADTLSSTLSFYTKVSTAKIGNNACTVYEYKGADAKAIGRLYISDSYKVILKWEELSDGAVTYSYEFSDFTVGKVTDADVTVPASVTITDINSLLSDAG